MKKKRAFQLVNGFFLAAAIIVALYIMGNGLGLVDSLDFGAGAYYYADIPEFSKYTDGAWYSSPVPMWVLILLFFIWGAFMYRIWEWIDRKAKSAMDES